MQFKLVSLYSLIVYLPIEPFSPHCLSWENNSPLGFIFDFLYRFTLPPPHSISISASHLSVPGMVCTRRSGQRHHGAELCMCVGVFVSMRWSESECVAYPWTWQWELFTIIKLHLFCPLLPSSIGFPVSPCILWLFLSVIALLNNTILGWGTVE